MPCIVRSLRENTPGDWLRQEDIASQMGVSMTPVREALDLLVAKGIAERVPYRGVRVREMSQKDIVEAYGMRLMLEAMIAKEAALNITPGADRRLEAIMDEMDRHVELSEMPQERQLSREFHAAIAEASGNDLVDPVICHRFERIPRLAAIRSALSKAGVGFEQRGANS
jgi:DNA-binding GntR family transcriptional regulator